MDFFGGRHPMGQAASAAHRNSNSQNSEKENQHNTTTTTTTTTGKGMGKTTQQRSLDAYFSYPQRLAPPLAPPRIILKKDNRGGARKGAGRKKKRDFSSLDASMDASKRTRITPGWWIYIKLKLNWRFYIF